jgi:hypothetical protein
MRVLTFFNLVVTVLSMASIVATAATDDADSAYRLGSGYSIGETGVRIGGYANAGISVPHAEPWHFKAHDLSLFLTWDNGSRLHFSRN